MGRFVFIACILFIVQQVLAQESCEFFHEHAFDGVDALSTGLIPVLNHNSKKVLGCTWEEQLKYYTELKRVHLRVNLLLEQVENYSPAPLTANDYKKIKTVKKTLNCINEKFIGKIKIRCEDCSLTRESKTNAYVVRLRWPILGTVINPKEIHVCTNRMDSFTDDVVGGILLHELSHKCGTGFGEEDEYFVHSDSIDSTKALVIENWHKNADHYRYWYHNAFCIPGIDCEKPVQQP